MCEKGRGFSVRGSGFGMPPAARRLCLAAFGFFFSLSLRAEVFWRLPKQTDAFLQELGGSCVYATPVQINGRPGTLSTHAFPSSAASVSAGLARRFGLPPAAPFGGTFITHTEKDRLYRLLVLPSAAGTETCVILSLDQSVRDAAKSKSAPSSWPEGVPALAAEPLFSAVCSATRTAFVTAESQSSPSEAAQDAAQALRSAGWTEISPTSPTFKTFSSGRKICLLLSGRSAQTQRTTISVLQREGASP